MLTTAQDFTLSSDPAVGQMSSAWLGFQAGPPSGGGAVLMKVPITGATPTRIAAIDGNLRGASWGEDDAIVFTTTRHST